MAPDPRRTKILATIGPASGDRDRLAALVDAGMDAARLNFSHATHDQHRSWADLIRSAGDNAGRPLALVGDLERPSLLARGEEVVIAPEEAARDGDLPVSPAVIGEVLTAGNDVLIDDGLVRLRVEEVEDGRARCAVVVGGVVSSHKGVNLPGVVLPIPSLTPKDRSDLELALELEVDYVALSFVRKAEDVRELCQLIDQAGSHAEVIAKIEKPEAVDALDDILAATDAIMVARGDLGVEIGPASVPLLQKRIILRSLQLGKPVITATQMLESMIEHAEPTRAEASDVANAILDGSSALMLSGETAVGAYPIEAVSYMDRIARAVEPSLGYRHQMPDPGEETTVGRAMSNAACDLAEALGARAILVPTATGKTASAVARLRPQRPIVGLTHNRYALQQMALEWGVIPLLLTEAENVQELWDQAIAAARDAGLVDAGDRMVITAGTSVNIPGTTNLIKVDIA
jgi:pyruvate kinase